ncbi:unnamed protein product [Calicophoron daubneyi]|uniref:Transposase n=1 Tax=Calicophoron daubneyi TaxID=300641 RepID=A0AAV2TQ55_CALDB
MLGEIIQNTSSNWKWKSIGNDGPSFYWTTPTASLTSCSVQWSKSNTTTDFQTSLAWTELSQPTTYVFPRAQRWCRAMAPRAATYGHTTNNFVEANHRVIKSFNLSGRLPLWTAIRRTRKAGAVIIYERQVELMSASLLKRTIEQQLGLQQLLDQRMPAAVDSSHSDNTKSSSSVSVLLWK